LASTRIGSTFLTMPPPLASFLGHSSSEVGLLGSGMRWEMTGEGGEDLGDPQGLSVSRFGWRYSPLCHG
jgi:hypothetical protein